MIKYEGRVGIKGSYIILIENSHDKELEVGKLGEIYFRRGFYAYVGSAMSGIEARIDRHLRVEKKTFWHIDYILPEMKVLGLIFAELEGKYECVLAEELSSSFDIIDSFGSSDCKCRSHLFFCPDYERLHKGAFRAFLLIP